MKRFIKAFTLITALAVITLALVSCSVGSEAASLYKKAIKNMDKLNSFAANSVAELEAYSGRQKISTTVNTLTEVALVDGELEFYRKSTTKTKHDDDASSSTVTEGYFDGIAYYVYNENGYSTKLKSELTSARYAEYVTSTSDTVDYNKIIRYCDKQEATQDSDGIWTLTFSEMSEKGLEKMYSELGILSLFIAPSVTPLSDVVISATVSDENYDLLSLSVDYVFKYAGTDESASARIPSFKNTVSYTEINEATVHKETEIAKYKLVDDLTAINEVSEAFTNAFLVENGSFTLNAKTKTNVKGSGGSKITETDTSNEISFKTDSNGFSYVMITVADELKNTSRYSNGKLSTETVKADTDRVQDSSLKQSNDVEQKLAIYRLLDSPVLTGKGIVSATSSKKDGTTVYSFEIIDAGDGVTASITSQLGSTVLPDSKATLEITLCDGKLSSYEYSGGCEFSISLLPNQRVSGSVDFEYHLEYKEAE